MKQTVTIVLDKCNVCRECEEVCPHGAIYERVVPRRMEIRTEDCDNCGDCIDACKEKAIIKSKSKYGKPSISRNEPFADIKF